MHMAAPPPSGVALATFYRALLRPLRKFNSLMLCQRIAKENSKISSVTNCNDATTRSKKTQRIPSVTSCNGGHVIARRAAVLCPANGVRAAMLDTHNGSCRIVYVIDVIT